MELQSIRNFSDFCSVLLQSGFSMGGGSAHGIFAAIPYGWDDQQSVDSPVKWHTGDRETDPWEWRMRVLEERTDIAYAKLFFRTSGYISKEWYPYFLACRRNGVDFDETYESGKASVTAKRIYDIIRGEGEIPLHEIKAAGGFGREDGNRFDRALTELQEGMFVTMCGRRQKQNKSGEGYGWSSTVFCTAESFWNERGAGEIFDSFIAPREAESKITGRILELNLEADGKAITKFIYGRPAQ